MGKRKIQKETENTGKKSKAEIAAEVEAEDQEEVCHRR